MMSSDETVAVKADRILMSILEGAAFLLSIALILWAGLLIVGQCGGWLKSGEWQPVPAYAILLTEDAKIFTLQAYEAGVQPLGLVPSWGDSESLEQIAVSMARNALGAQKVFKWLLELPLALWLVIASGMAALFQLWVAESQLARG